MHSGQSSPRSRAHVRAGLVTALALASTLLAASAAAAQNASVEAAVALLEAGRNAEAKAMLATLTRQRPSDARAMHLHGRAHLNLSEIDEAVRLLERAVQLDASRPEYHVVLGQAYGAQLSAASALRQRAIAERLRLSLERALELDAANVPARVHLVQFHLRAPAIVGGDPKLAQRHADAIVPHNAYVGAFMQLSVHEAAHDSVAMEGVLRGLVGAAPDSVAPRLGLVLLYQDRGRARESWPLLQPLVERDRPHHGALYLVGRLSAVSGIELERGERALRRYLQSTPQPGEPSHAAARTRIGDILQHRGDMAGARREYEAALRLDPEFQPAKDALRRLR
ncbi:hypothetical protein BH23GEM9_BH23GEM9_26890 [soil metagenome]